MLHSKLVESDDSHIEILALRRIADGSLEHTITQKEAMDCFGITEKDLAEMDDVEIE